MIWALETYLSAEDQLRRCFLFRLCQDAVLDIVFGRPDAPDYVSTTTPPSPPPYQ
jgi:hypothetical protein